MRLLYIDDIVPDSRLGYGYPRSLVVLHALVECGYEVVLFPMQDGGADSRNPVGRSVPGVEAIAPGAVPSAAFRRFYKCYGSSFAAVWVSRLANLRLALPIVRLETPNTPLVYDAEALTEEREEARRQVTGAGPGAQRPPSDREGAWISRADIVVAVSERDQRLIQQMSTRGVLRAGMSFHCVPSEVGYRSRRDLLFLGSFLTPTYAASKHLSPNVDALIYFARQILPLVRKRVDCRLNVAGWQSERFLGAEWAADSAISILGTLATTHSASASARLLVAPTRYAGGIALKVLDAMAQGLPVVVSRLIATQLGIDDRMAGIADGVTGFADRTVELYTDEERWDQCRRHALAFVRKHYGPRSVLEALMPLRRLIMQMGASTH